MHLFFSCPTVQARHTEFVQVHFNDLNMNGPELIKFWFMGILPNHTSSSFAVLSAVLLFQYCIWEEKLRKRKPACRTLNILFDDVFTASLKKNKDFFKSASGLNFAIFRPVRGLDGPVL
jgi:hypothetical protein